MEDGAYNAFYYDMRVTVHSVLCIYCTVREKVIQECINPIATGDFKWIYAGYWSRSEQ